MENTKIDVLICVTKLRNEEKIIFKYLEEFGINIQINLDSMELPSVNKMSEKVEIALIRSLSQTNALNRASLLEAAGVKTINSSKSISICINKIYQSLMFRKFNIPQPKFKVSFTASDMFEAFEDIGDTFVIKPASSSWGRGIAKIIDKDCLDGWIAARESLDPNQKSFPVLMQEYVEKGDFDIRVVIVGRKPIVAFKRVSIDNWKTNTHLGAEINPIEINTEMEIICNQVLDMLGEGIYGLDLFYDHKRKCYLVCEVNQNPEFDSSSKVHGIDVAYYIAEYLKGKILLLEKAV